MGNRAPPPDVCPADAVADSLPAAGTKVPYSHHERWDGKGYPLGLKGEQIPLAARIYAVADAWHVLRAPRPYRPAWNDAQARRHLQAEAGAQFDPVVVDAFFSGLR